MSRLCHLSERDESGHFLGQRLHFLLLDRPSHNLGVATRIIVGGHVQPQPENRLDSEIAASQRDLVPPPAGDLGEFYQSSATHAVNPKDRNARALPRFEPFRLYGVVSLAEVALIEQKAAQCLAWCYCPRDVTPRD